MILNEDQASNTMKWSIIMYKLIKPLLFKIEPEKAHGLTVDALKFTQKNAFYYLCK